VGRLSTLAHSLVSATMADEALRECQESMRRGDLVIAESMGPGVPADDAPAMARRHAGTGRGGIVAAAGPMSRAMVGMTSSQPAHAVLCPLRGV